MITRPTRAISVAAICAVGLTTLATAPSAVAASAAVTTHAVATSDQRAALAYWTPKRMAAAKSAELVTVAPSAAHSSAHAARARVGHAGSVPGGSAAGIEHAAGGPGLRASAASYPFPYTSFYVPSASYTQWPYRLNGKIFFTNNGSSYWCSGTSVASYHGGSLEDEVWTAGHCVGNTSLTDPGTWDSYAVFVPAYNGYASNPEPFGAFVASRYSIATNFFQHGDISVDEGAMEVGTNSSGQTLGQAVGWDGFAWNWSPQESFTTFGYPAASPYNGLSLVEDISSTGQQVTWSGGAGQPLVGIGSPLTGGSSGGAWNVNWSSSGPGYIDGHNDYKFYSQPLAMYSPYQDSLSNTVRCFGATSC